MSDTTPDPSPAPAALTIELREQSGPVSPRFQYRVSVVLTVGADGAHLRHDEVGEFAQGEPRRKIQRAGALPRPVYEALWAELTRLQVLTLGGDLINDRGADAAHAIGDRGAEAAHATGDEGRRRVGVSHNFFALRLPGPPPQELRCDYLLSQVDEDNDDHDVARAAVVKQLKELWRALPAP